MDEGDVSDENCLSFNRFLIVVVGMGKRGRQI